MIDVELRGVRKSFGRTVAVQSIDLAVKRGEFVALLGPSGCGKTTTLRMIAGFEQPDAGAIRIKEKDVTQLAPYLRDIGMVFQSYALFPHMTVFDNIAYGLHRRKVPKAEIRTQVVQALDMVRLSGLQDRYPRQLSGGQQQRVAVARAIVIRPSVLLFDEPLSNLDAKLRLEMRSELRRLQQRLEISTIFVTHDQEEALSMADQVVVINQGNVEQVGPPEEIYSRPKSRFVAGFIGECNFLPGSVLHVSGGIASVKSGNMVLKVAVAGTPLAPNMAGTIILRPENTRLVAPGEIASGATNVVDGQVREITYLGASRQYRIALKDGPELLLRLQGGQAVPLREEEPVQVAWDVDAASFYPEAMAQ